ncbi:hypothetical protein PENARI_c018G01048 [Penicillium arizonense]|uniref:Uncharacterized protein n=1 Tax=Penicillium arizonense TaxID=1835702 RepID=A0A1F5LA72_PENAI|nr:hypothetical protein PENARI_c018G01048 [Penicillium arizonense]OGE50104.1 hypothetical protein PENARI_c018G01048 [Penicillium arizonense]
MAPKLWTSTGPGGFRSARLVGIVINDRIGTCVAIDIVYEAVEQLSQVSILRTGLDGADDQLYCRFITIPEKGDEIFGEVAIAVDARLIRLSLSSPPPGLSLPAPPPLAPIEVRGARGRRPRDVSAIKFCAERRNG